MRMALVFDTPVQPCGPNNVHTRVAIHIFQVLSLSLPLSRTHTHTDIPTQTHTHTSRGARSSSCLRVTIRLWSRAEEH